MITCLAGGVGAARFLSGLVQVVPAGEITAVVNTGDDTVLHGLHISPDLDTVTYTLAGAVNPETGWGLQGETWAAMDSLERYGGETWFRLGDKDLATHLYRTHRMAHGAKLSEVTAEIAAAWGVGPRLLPMTDDPIETRITLPDGSELGFQEWFVGQRHATTVASVDFAGADEAEPAPGVVKAVEQAELVVVCPSNPIVSIGPLMAVGGIRLAVERARSRVVAVSPIVAGRALKGPADRLMTDLGHEPSVVGVARLYAPFAGTLVVDEADAGLAGAVESAGMACAVAPSVMHDASAAAALARSVVAVPR